MGAPVEVAPYRLLVTASRDWTDPLKMWETLTHFLCEARGQGRDLLIVHGDAAGGDQIAKLFGLVRAHCGEEGHPADWKAPCRSTCQPGHRQPRKDGDYCPAAGMYRNKEEIVGPGGDYGVAFIKNNSPGASGCLKMMRAAGIPVTVVRA